MEHTRGPWVAGAGGHPELIFSALDDHGFISEMNCNRHDWEANARLIAAAPDLLAACVAMLRNVKPGTDDSILEFAYEAIGNAIGLGTGTEVGAKLVQSKANRTADSV